MPGCRASALVVANGLPTAPRWRRQWFRFWDSWRPSRANVTSVSRSLLELNNAYRGTALVLGDVVEADDGYTGEHCKSVVELALARRRTDRV